MTELHFFSFNYFVLEIIGPKLFTDQFARMEAV